MVVFIFVPGAWHTEEFFQTTRDYLHKKGYETLAIGHKNLEVADPGPCSFREDASKVEEVVKGVVQEGKDVVLVMHSYGGIIGSQATGKLYGNAHGYQGKVLHLVYVASILPFVGETMAEPNQMITEFIKQDPNAVALSSMLDLVDGKMVCKKEIKGPFYEDLSESDQDKYYGFLKGMPVEIMTNTDIAVTHVGWHHIPSTYVYAKRDRIAIFVAQKHLVDRANKELQARATESPGGPDCVQTFEMDSDHCSMFVLPQQVEKLTQILINTSL